MSLAVANRPAGPEAPLPPREPQAASLSDRAWVTVVTATDAVLRRIYGVQTFSDHPACLLRIARGTAPHRITLRDGTAVAAGAPIAMLHFWNEHLPHFPPDGPDLAWARLFRECMVISLQELSHHLQATPAWYDVRIIHACVNFGSRRRRWQIQRAAARFGFELLPTEVPCGLHEWGENMLIWAFVRAFNPPALRRHALWRDRTGLWISKASLISRYG
ncbi:YkoP family protein [Rhodopila globiformis]|uniref:YkoP family protein n=1 Tax=Rhodopila globiformis TaxID=1071 RepID=UPI001304BC62|nr:hypothetical protein [Rhodopila globiformis]